MKFSIERDIFSGVLSKIQGVCNLRTTLQFSSSCRIKVEAGKVTIYGTNMDISIRVLCEAEVLEEGEVLLNAKRLFDTIKSLQPGLVTLTLNGSQVLIESGSAKANLMTGNVCDFPELPDMDQEASFKMGASSLLDLIDKTFFSISTDESRPDFTGALLVIRDGEKVQMVSTDGHRLSRAETNSVVITDSSATLSKGVIVPRAGLDQIKKILSDGDVEVAIVKQNIIVKTPNATVSIRLIPGRFPDFTRVIPEHLEHKSLVSRLEFIQMIKRASNFSPKVGTIRLMMSPSKLEIHAFDPECGEIHDYIDSDYNGEGVCAGFNYRYVLDVLNAISGDTVSLEVVDTESPSVMRDASTSRYDYVVMPMAL